MTRKRWIYGGILAVLIVILVILTLVGYLFRVLSQSDIQETAAEISGQAAADWLDVAPDGSARIEEQTACAPREHVLDAPGHLAAARPDHLSAGEREPLVEGAAAVVEPLDLRGVAPVEGEGTETLRGGMEAVNRKPARDAVAGLQSGQSDGVIHDILRHLPVGRPLAPEDRRRERGRDEVEEEAAEETTAAESETSAGEAPDSATE